MDAQKILVGVENTPESFQALHWACDYALYHKLPLVLLHAYGATPPASTGAALQWESYLQSAQEHAETFLHQALREAQEHLQGKVPVGTLLQVGSVAAALVHASSNAHVSVLGSKGHGRIAGMLLGALAIPVAAHAHSPVIIERSHHHALPTNAPIVVGVDAHHEHHKLLEFAHSEARRHKVPLRVVYAYDNRWLGADELSVGIPTDQDLHDTGERILAEALGGWSNTHPDVVTTRVVRAGNPGKVLLEEGQDSRMVIVGSRGRGGFAGLLLGSTSHALLHNNSVSVAVLRTPRNDT